MLNPGSNQILKGISVLKVVPNIFTWMNGGLVSGCFQGEENRLLVIDEAIEFEKQPIEVQRFLRRITDHSRGICGIHLKLMKKTERSRFHVTGWAWKQLGSRPIVPKNAPWTLVVPPTVVRIRLGICTLSLYDELFCTAPIPPKLTLVSRSS